jgi:hypothetical protein
MLSSAIHMILHFLVPAIVAWVFFRKDFKKAFLMMIATMLVDIDHLLAVPLFDPLRCSIGFHPLHSYYLQPFYLAMCLFKPTRYIGIGLVIHMSLDMFDCFKLI